MVIILWTPDLSPTLLTTTKNWGKNKWGKSTLKAMFAFRSIKYLMRSMDCCYHTTVHWLLQTWLLYSWDPLQYRDRESWNVVQQPYQWSQGKTCTKWLQKMNQRLVFDRYSLQLRIQSHWHEYLEKLTRWLTVLVLWLKDLL